MSFRSSCNGAEAERSANGSKGISVESVHDLLSVFQISELEAALGQWLFQRHGRAVVLTQAGERLLPVAKKVTGLLEAALREMTADGFSGTLRVGVPYENSWLS